MNRRRRRQLELLRRLVVVVPPTVVGAVYLVGLTLPAVEEVRRSVEVPQSAETLWAVLTDLDGMPSWRPDLRSLERLPTTEGRERWREVRTDGAVALERREARAPWRMVVVDLGSTPGEGQARWTFSIERTGSGARLDLVQERSVGGPFARPFVYIFSSIFGWRRGEINGLCRDLERRLMLSRPVIAGR